MGGRVGRQEYVFAKGSQLAMTPMWRKEAAWQQGAGVPMPANSTSPTMQHRAKQCNTPHNATLTWKL